MQENNLLNKFYQPLDIDKTDFAYQFLLSKELDLIPEGWDRYEKGEWLLGASGLPILDIENAAGKDIGWCVGYPVHHKDPWTKKIVIDCQDSEFIDMIGVEKFYLDNGGRYVLVLLTQKEEKVFLDPIGSLAAVFSTSEPTVASTPTLLGDRYDWDEELILSLNMPESDLWFPSGLTPKKKVRRLLPNHYLDLNDWQVIRHWPCAASDIDVKQDIDETLSVITSCLTKTIGNIAKHYPIQSSLTAGKDTRMVLACARDYLSDAIFITFSRGYGTDMHIASKLAKKFSLRHYFLPFKPATEDEMIHWQYLTGHAVGGGIWKIHKLLESYDPQRVMLNGVAGEAGRAIGWNKHDFNELLDAEISTTELLKKYNLPCAERIVEETDKWLSGLSGYSRLRILDLFYLEQKKGCWSSPMFYANTFSKFEISPFNHRRIFHAFMKLPGEYRFRGQLPLDICLRQWPELMEFPFNEFTGLKKYKNLKRKVVNYSWNTVGFAKTITKKILPEKLISKIRP